MNDLFNKLNRQLQSKTLSDLELILSSVVALHTDEPSHAQLGQDLVALACNGFKRNGCFVEFGAADGIYLSNSHLLEHGFGWQGIVAEPARVWHSDLKRNRKCFIETDCVWKVSGETLRFSAPTDATLSTISQFSGSDQFATTRKSAETYDVQTISLNDLLKKYEAPATIDYMSVDTEGSEFDILSAFDFSKHRFNFVSIEHNYTSSRTKIRKLMESNGYRRVFETLSRYDDWYIPAPA